MTGLVIVLLILIGLTGVVAAASMRAASKRRLRAAIRYVNTYSFPPGLFDKLGRKHPHLSKQECELVGFALRQFFLAYLKSGRRFVSMPSQIVDDLWHEMILYTKAYQIFCQNAFGRFMHHTPAAALGSSRNNNAGLRRCWWYACLEENMNPKAPSRLPLLFRLDEQLNVANGFHYALDCSGLRNLHAGGAGVIYCAGDFASADFDGSTDGFGDSVGADSGDGGSGASSCSGGCSGGCGGGGD